MCRPIVKISKSLLLLIGVLLLAAPSAATDPIRIALTCTDTAPDDNQCDEDTRLIDATGLSGTGTFYYAGPFARGSNTFYYFRLKADTLTGTGPAYRIGVLLPNILTPNDPATGLSIESTAAVNTTTATWAGLGRSTGFAASSFSANMLMDVVIPDVFYIYLFIEGTAVTNFTGTIDMYPVKEGK